MNIQINIKMNLYMKAVLSWISGVSFPPSFQVLLFSLSFNGVTSINDLFPPKRSIFGITLPRVYIHVSYLQMMLQDIFVTQLLPTTFPLYYNVVKCENMTCCCTFLVWCTSVHQIVLWKHRTRGGVEGFFSYMLHVCIKTRFDHLG